MDLSTRYLGFDLPHPLIVGASPLADDLDSVRRLEDAGAAAIVFRSLFEEQLAVSRVQAAASDRPMIGREAMSMLPRPDEYALDRDHYLEHLRRAKEAVKVPLVASLNGTTLGGWLAHARLLEQAGADALELNLYQLVIDPADDSVAVEEREVELVAAVSDALLVPVAVKLSPFYTALPRFARRLDAAGAAGLVLFNRFYQAEIDLETLEVRPELRLSDSRDLLLRLRWLAVLRGQIRGSLAATGGVHTADDALKAVLCGADAVQLVSELLANGLERLEAMRLDLSCWLERLECQALSDLAGSLSLERNPDARGYERAQYIWMLQQGRPDANRSGGG